jgi:hypothetical protein
LSERYRFRSRCCTVLQRISLSSLYNPIQFCLVLACLALAWQGVCVYPNVTWFWFRIRAVMYTIDCVYVYRIMSTVLFGTIVYPTTICHLIYWQISNSKRIVEFFAFSWHITVGSTRFFSPKWSYSFLVWWCTVRSQLLS